MKAKTSQNAKRSVQPMFAHPLFRRDGDCHCLLAVIAGENTKFLGMFTPERASVALCGRRVNGECQNLAVAPRGSRK